MLQFTSYPFLLAYKNIYLIFSIRLQIFCGKAGIIPTTHSLLNMNIQKSMVLFYGWGLIKVPPTRLGDRLTFIWLKMEGCKSKHD